MTSFTVGVVVIHFTQLFQTCENVYILVWGVDEVLGIDTDAKLHYSYYYHRVEERNELLLNVTISVEGESENRDFSVLFSINTDKEIIQFMAKGHPILFLGAPLPSTQKINIEDLHQVIMISGGIGFAIEGMACTFLEELVLQE